MLRVCRLLATVALLSVLTVLAFPGSGSALRAVPIVLTAAGPSPTALTIPAGLYPVWFNNDTVAHTVRFDDGSCTFEAAAGGYGQCPRFAAVVGTFPYTVDGTAHGSIVVVPEGRAVYLVAKSHTIKRGKSLALHGELDVPTLSPPAPPARQPVTVLARPDRYHPFRSFRTVMAKTHGYHLD